MARAGIHYTMLPACTDERRQGVTYGGVLAGSVAILLGQACRKAAWIH